MLRQLFHNKTDIVIQNLNNFFDKACGLLCRLGLLAHFSGVSITMKVYTATKYLTWISTHPDSKERAEYIIEYSKDKLKEFRPILSNETWDRLKVELN